MRQARQALIDGDELAGYANPTLSSQQSWQTSSSSSGDLAVKFGLSSLEEQGKDIVFGSLYKSMDEFLFTPSKAHEQFGPELMSDQQRRAFEDTRSARIAVAAFVALVLGQIGTIVSMKMTFNAYSENYSFFLQILQLLAYEGACLIILVYQKGTQKARTNIMRNYPKWKLLVIATCDACAYACIAAGTAGTPGPLMVLLNHLPVAWTMLLSSCLSQQKHSKTQIFGVAVILFGITLSLVPVYRGEADSFTNFQPMQVAAYACSSFFVAASALFKDIELKKARNNATAGAPPVDVVCLSVGVTALLLPLYTAIYALFSQFGGRGGDDSHIVPFRASQWGEVVEGGARCFMGEADLIDFRWQQQARNPGAGAGAGAGAGTGVWADESRRHYSCAYDRAACASGRPCCTVLWETCFFACSLVQGLAAVALHKYGSGVLTLVAKALCVAPSFALFALPALTGETYPPELVVAMGLILAGLLMYQQLVKFHRRWDCAVRCMVDECKLWLCCVTVGSRRLRWAADDDLDIWDEDDYDYDDEHIVDDGQERVVMKKSEVMIGNLAQRIRTLWPYGSGSPVHNEAQRLRQQNISMEELRSSSKGAGARAGAEASDGGIIDAFSQDPSNAVLNNSADRASAFSGGGIPPSNPALATPPGSDSDSEGDGDDL